MSEGDCIVLVSPHGQGRRRTLEDLRGCLPASMPAFQANLRNYPSSLQAMLADLTSQTSLAPMDSLDGLIDRLPQLSERTLIILHNFDELQPGRISGYDDAFFETLNGIRKRPGIALLCVSERLPENWPLHIETVPLPPLTPDQILAELTRRNVPAQPESWPEIASWLAGKPEPYSLLDLPETWPDRHR